MCCSGELFQSACAKQQSRQQVAAARAAVTNTSINKTLLQHAFNVPIDSSAYSCKSDISPPPTGGIEVDTKKTQV
jgi:hypothetical protein